MKRDRFPPTIPGVKKTLFISVALVCASAVVCSLILVEPSVSFRREGSVKVKGSSSKIVVSDSALWSADVESSGATPAESYANIARARAAILDFLKQNGVKAEGVESSLSFFPVRKRNSDGFETGEISGIPPRLKNVL